MPNSRHSAKKDVAEHRYAGQPMPSAALLPRVWHSAKKSFAECIFCRVPGTQQRTFNRVPFFAECSTRQRRSLPSARFLTLGKDPVSSSEYITLHYITTFPFQIFLIQISIGVREREHGRSNKPPDAVMP